MNNWLSFILGIISSVLIAWLFFLSGNISNLEKEIRDCQYELRTCEADLKSKEKLSVENKKLQVEITYKIKEIDLLEETVISRNNRIKELDTSVKVKEDEIQILFTEIKDLVSGGITEKTKKELNLLNSKIKILNLEKSDLLTERSKLNSELLKIRKDKINLEKIIDHYKNIQIPNYKKNIDKIEQELLLAKKFKDYLNIRADISNIDLDFDKNEIIFDISFNDNDFDYLINRSGIKDITLNPVIENKTKGVFLQPDVTNFDYFTISKHEISNPYTIRYPIKGYELKKNHKKRRLFRSDRGDDLVFKVTVEELNRLVVVNQKINVRS